MMFVGGTNVKHLIILGILAVLGVALVAFILIEVNGVTYIQNRMLSWTDPFNEELSQDETWQTKNSLIAIGSGGWFGLGLGNSRQKFLYLPESQNDFVFAVVCEELGFVGALLVIILFLLFIIRGFFIAAKAPDKFGMMIVVGLTVQIGLQALLNIAVVTNTIPNTGVSLPFFSYGGTALIMQLAQMGIILNVSRQSIIKT
jgi:cell division protein FtsW